MDTAPVPRQRSPWFYVLLGCGGLAGLMCLGLGGSGLYCAKQAQALSEGVTNPAERQKNAVEQLGAVPEGYQVVASFSLLMGMAKQTLLTDQPLLADGGIPHGGRQFAYTSSRGETAKVRAFLDGTDPDGAHLGESRMQFSLPIEPRSVFKRGQLLVDGRRIFYLATRVRDTATQGAGQALLTVVSFDCPDQVLRFGAWSQPDPSPEVKPEELKLEGTVADEAELARFLKVVTPCGR
jgi:hypothetical protein